MYTVHLIQCVHPMWKHHSGLIFSYRARNDAIVQTYHGQPVLFFFSSACCNHVQTM